MGRILSLVACALVVLASSNMAVAHDGHDHPTPKPKPTKDVR
ncbi:MAG: hypothetical protein VKP57_11955 [Candidatus Sericytochromatia bacterium]|nr:hypothetical protein [Candidatus Sericytochromatia bacterium]